jgi:molecular chaperone DnaK
MALETLQFGIDLGTTNSALARLEDKGPTVIKNGEEAEVTPSVVRIDARGVVTVGRRARQHLEADPLNTRGEFKRVMGTTDRFQFEKANKSFAAEELSAEVLKALRADARERTGVDMDGAVITVPALFELSQCEATSRAAKLAGLETCALLQEPIASAIACGFTGVPTDGYWLVYDLGGGTFDASLMNATEGRMRVVDQAGDNFLGGKDFDWKLVELVVKRLQEQYALPELRRGAPKYLRALARLKAGCEDAKIELSRKELTSVQIPALCLDDAGAEVDVDVPIKRAEYEALIEPAVEKSLLVCKTLLDRHGLHPKSLEKLILIGGPTLTPMVRQAVEVCLQKKPEVGVDPMTAVAQGAAVFGGTVRKEKPVQVAVSSAGACPLQLEFPSISQDTEPYLVGRAASETSRPAFVELSRDDGGWASGKVPLDAKGGFVVALNLRARRANRFTVRATDDKGANVAVTPAEISITHGMTLLDPLLSRSLGVSLASNLVQVYFEKGTALPARRTFTHKSVETLRQGSDQALLSIPVVQGESHRANRNRKVGELVIAGKALKRTLPANSEIEVTLEIDRSGRLHAQAFVPLLEEMFEEVVRVAMPTADANALEASLEAEHDRLDDLRGKALRSGNQERAQALAKVGARLNELQDLVRAAKGGDVDAGQQAERGAQELQEQLDEAEDALQWPELEQEAMRELMHTRAIVIEHNGDTEKRHFHQIESELHAALKSKKPQLVEEKTFRLRQLSHAIYFRQDSAWEYAFEDLASDLGQFTDLPKAKTLVDQGRRALKTGSREELKTTVRALWELQPVDTATRLRGHNSGVR